MSVDRDKRAYAVLETCGCVSAAISVTHRQLDRSSKAEVRRWMREGRHVVRMEPEEVRERLILSLEQCPHRDKADERFEVVTEVPA